MIRIGVLALQGGFGAHISALAAAGFATCQVRDARDLDGLAGIVLPGGESSTQLSLLEYSDLQAPLIDAIAAGLPTLATCAGLILLAREVCSPAQRSLGLLDITVERNAYGRQLQSARRTSDSGRELVLIRAPRIARVGADVEILDCLEHEPVLVRQLHIVGATFHPELSDDRRLYHAVFSDEIRDVRRAAL